jgi:quaternary ammonium compound-resistance protein SugE
LLVVAGLLEVVWAIALKRSEGMSRIPETVAFVVAGAASFLLLAQALRVLPVGSAYAVWTGIGAVGAFTVGILWLGESAGALRIASATFVVVGIAGLAATASH